MGASLRKQFYDVIGCALKCYVLGNSDGEYTPFIRIPNFCWALLFFNLLTLSLRLFFNILSDQGVNFSVDQRKKNQIFVNMLLHHRKKRKTEQNDKYDTNVDKCIPEHVA